MKQRIILLVALLFSLFLGCLPSPTDPNASLIQSVILKPDSLDHLQSGDKVTLQISLTEAPTASCLVSIQPYYQGELVRGVTLSPPRPCAKDSADNEASISLSRSGSIDQILVRLLDPEEKKTLASRLVAFQAKWEADSEGWKELGDSRKVNHLELLSATPPLPAQLNAGEPLRFKIHYNLVSQGGAYVSVRPYKEGKVAVATCATCSPPVEAGSGVVERYFTLRTEGAVDRVLLQMLDKGSRNTIAEVFYDIEASWKGSIAQLPSESQPERMTLQVTRDEFDAELSNMPQLLSQARAVPYFKNGSSVGMRLFAIRRGSLYETLGLKNGDILKSVNEQALSEPQNALKLFEVIKSAAPSPVQLLLERNGQDVSIAYAWRGEVLYALVRGESTSLASPPVAPVDLGTPVLSGKVLILGKPITETEFRGIRPAFSIRDANFGNMNYLPRMDYHPETGTYNVYEMTNKPVRKLPRTEIGMQVHFRSDGNNYFPPADYTGRRVIELFKLSDQERSHFDINLWHVIHLTEPENIFASSYVNGKYDNQRNKEVRHLLPYNRLHSPVTFRWEKISGAAKYIFKIVELSDGERISDPGVAREVVNKTLSEESLTENFAPSAKGMHYMMTIEALDAQNIRIGEYIFTGVNGWSWYYKFKIDA